MGTHASAAEPERPHHVGPDRPTGRGVAPQAPYPTPLAKRSLRRQTPEVGAVCGQAARTDLCGGTGVTRFPTAIAMGAPVRCSREFGMKWRVMLELVGPDGIVGVHEVGGRAAVAAYAPGLG